MLLGGKGFRQGKKISEGTRQSKETSRVNSYLLASIRFLSFPDNTRPDRQTDRLALTFNIQVRTNHQTKSHKTIQFFRNYNRSRDRRVSVKGTKLGWIPSRLEESSISNVESTRSFRLRRKTRIFQIGNRAQGFSYFLDFLNFLNFLDFLNFLNFLDFLCFRRDRPRQSRALVAVPPCARG